MVVIYLIAFEFIDAINLYDSFKGGCFYKIPSHFDYSQTEVSRYDDPICKKGKGYIEIYF